MELGSADGRVVARSSRSSSSTRFTAPDLLGLIFLGFLLHWMLDRSFVGPTVAISGAALGDSGSPTADGWLEDVVESKLDRPILSAKLSVTGVKARAAAIESIEVSELHRET